MDISGVFTRLEQNILEAIQENDPSHISRAAKSGIEKTAEVFRTDPIELLEWATDAGNLVPQSWSNDFGEPVLTVTQNQYFRIDVLFWAHNVSPTHSHVSCGAFAPLHGERLHRTYTFDGLLRPAEEIAIGNLSSTSASLAVVGEVHEIQPGLIHDLFWLHQPSVTLSVRCVSHPGGSLLPWEFWSPGLAVIDMTLQPNANVQRQLSALRLLQRTVPARFKDRLSKIVRGGQHSLIYHLCADVASTAWGKEYVDELVQLLHSRNDEVGRALLVVIPEIRSRALYSSIRSSSTSRKLYLSLTMAGLEQSEVERQFVARYGRDQLEGTQLSSKSILEQINLDVSTLKREVEAPSARHLLGMGIGLENGPN